MKSVSLWISLACLLAALHASQGMICYSCNMNGGETDDTCVRDPESVTTSSPTTPCTKKYCVIIRQEYRYTGTINSFRRGCEDTLPKLNGVETDSQFKTYYKSCTTDRCNYGIGCPTDGSGGGSEGDSENFYVPGSGGAETLQGAVLGIVIAVALLTACFRGP